MDILIIRLKNCGFSKFTKKFLKRNKMGLTHEKIYDLHSWKERKVTKTQEDLYKEHDSPHLILDLARLGGPAFGSLMEKIAKEYFNLKPRIDSSHDHIKFGLKIEQKSARYCANGKKGKWQHIEMRHEWDVLIVSFLDFKEIKSYGASRKTIEYLIETGIISGQGKKKDGKGVPQQGYWFTEYDFSKKSKKFLDYFTEFKNERAINRYFKNLSLMRST